MFFNNKKLAIDALKSYANYAFENEIPPCPKEDEYLENINSCDDVDNLFLLVLEATDKLKSERTSPYYWCNSKIQEYLDKYEIWKLDYDQYLLQTIKLVINDFSDNSFG